MNKSDEPLPVILNNLIRKAGRKSSPSSGGRIERLEFHHHRKGENIVLGLIAVVLIVLWLLGLVTANTMGGFIHILLVIAVVMILLRLIQGRRVL